MNVYDNASLLCKDTCIYDSLSQELLMMSDITKCTDSKLQEKTQNWYRNFLINFLNSPMNSKQSIHARQH